MTNNQETSTKQNPNTNNQNPKRLVIEIWLLELVWLLSLVIWLFAR
jgi:hypothetical protein